MSPEYKSLEEETFLIGKFVRTKRKIFTGSITEYLNHTDIVRADGLMETINELKRTSPTGVDAGWIKIEEDGTISISEDSWGLKLPVCGYEKEARKITIKDFTEQSPNHTVTEK
jgi:hypothetical protein